ncbi:tyrosine-protein phosphatase [Sporosarcina gallistercoris]|uniref:Tyrosine-protein phosphatase n=1 Tax=Sporosarcina gallistercoris TaxID=2762245 RepID=A0ABR8PMK6_9BACL|nr:CpsB/CapC family capsule biosynthesis tyrosine phosphatase [Sporosarcina gallistercoris]MBD7909411.1 capsular biosynthesis protein [Sporosarcina gallistercoris]
MIDIHMHILFGVDDGPQTIEETMRILEIAHSEGITDIIATSHALHPQYHVAADEVRSQVRLLNDIIESSNLGITLHSGQEIRLAEDIVDKLKEKTLLTMADSRYILLELPSGSVPHYTTSIIQKLLAEGVTPVIAHPERNRGIAEKPERLERLVRAGALAQITAGSVAGSFGKNIQKLSLQLLEANLIHLYGSDAHNTTVRPPLFEKGLDVMEKKKLGEYADLVLENNSQLLKNERLTILETEVLHKTKKWWFF